MLVKELKLGNDALVVHRCGYQAIVRMLANGPYLRPIGGGSILEFCPDCGSVVDRRSIDEEWQLHTHGHSDARPRA